MIRTDLSKSERQRLFDYYLKLAAAADSQAAKQENRQATEDTSPTTGKSSSMYDICSKGETNAPASQE